MWFASFLAAAGLLSLGVRAQTTAITQLPNLATHPNTRAYATSSLLSAVDEPEESLVGLPHLAMDDNEATAWSSRIGDVPVELTVDLATPEDRISAGEAREAFVTSFGDQWPGFKVASCVVRWHGWAAAAEYSVDTSLDGQSWTRQSTQSRPLSFNRDDALGALDTAPSGASENPIRFVRITMTQHAACANDNFCTRRRLATDASVFAIRELELRGNAPSPAATRASAVVCLLLAAAVHTASQYTRR